MQDLKIAKERLNENNLTIVIVKNGKIVYETIAKGVSGFLDAFEKIGDKLEGASVADKVVGKAVALLCVYAKVKAVYAVVLSRKAKTFFEENMVYHEWRELTDNILDRDKNKLCPFEELAAKISNPKDAYKMLKALQNSLRDAR